MTRRERVWRAIRRDGPDRVPVHFHNRDLDRSDTATTGYAAPSGWHPACPEQTEWGYLWKRLDETMGQPECPPLENPDADWTPPDPDAPGRFDHLPAFIASEPERFRRFAVGISGFNQAAFLRGFEAFLEDLYAAPELARRALDAVFSFENRIIERAVAYDIDCVVFGDDWGTQQGLIVSPQMWRNVFKPRYAEQFAIVHAAGKCVWFHTCGQVRDILPDLVEIGADVLELLQPDTLGVEWLAQELGGKVCFACSVDHQTRALNGSESEIHEYARYLQRMLGRYRGGLIGYIEDYSCLGMTEDRYQWIRAAFEALTYEDMAS